MTMLQEIYDKGVNFIDIHGVLEENQDTVNISFCKAYMDEEYEKDFDIIGEEQFPSKVEVKFSDEDLEQLL